MVNHSSTSIFVHAKMGAAGGLRGGNSLATFNKAHHKTQIRAEKKSYNIFSSLFFVLSLSQNLLAILPYQS